MSKKIPAYIFVFLQLSSLMYIMVSGPWLAPSINGMLVEVAGLFLGVVAILTMKIGNFNIAPLPKTDGVLVTNGVYSILRHPMYLAQLLVVAPLVFDHFTWPRLIAVIVLLVDLVVKLHFEEKQLMLKFEGYAAYMEKSWRLLPYIY